MTEHTAGPWSVNTNGPWHTEVFAGTYLICEANGGQMHLGQLRNFEQDEANARLIAAAPDLFEACAGVWAMLADTDDPRLRPIVDEVRAAIEKAKPAPANISAL